MNSTQIAVALSKKHLDDFFITECKNGPTQTVHNFLKMDAVAIKKSWANPCVTVYEIKVARADFLRDSKWPSYLGYCNRFYFACPSGLIQLADIDDPRVGLIWVNENGNCITKKSVPTRATQIPSEFFQYIIFSKIDSDRIPFYSDHKEYTRACILDFIEDKKTARTLSHSFSSALIKKCADLENKLRDGDDNAFKAGQYNELTKVLNENGIYYPSSDDLVKLFSSAKKERTRDAMLQRLKLLAEQVIKFEKETDD